MPLSFKKLQIDFYVRRTFRITIDVKVGDFYGVNKATGKLYDFRNQIWRNDYMENPNHFVQITIQEYIKQTEF